MEIENNKDNLIYNIVDWSNPPKIADIKHDISIGREEYDKVIGKISEWRKAFESPNKSYGTNRSSYSSKLVKKMSRWTYPIIEDIFLSDDSIIDLEPRTFEDPVTTRLNKLILNKQFDNDINKTKLINDGVRSFVEEGTVVFKAGWSRKTIKKIVQEPVYNWRPTTNPQVAQQMQAQGLPPFERFIAGYEDVEKEVVIENKPTLDVVDNYKIMIDPSAKGNIRNAQFVVYEYTSNISDLTKEGYANLDHINLENSSFVIDEDDDINNTENFKDRARKIIPIYEYWGFWDTEGKGITDMVVLTIAGDIIIGAEKNPLPFDYLPFALAQFEPVKNSNFGEADAEVLKESQELIGAVTRGMIDLFARSANAQEGRPINFLNVVNKKKYESGEDYEYDPMYKADAIHMHKFPEIPASAFNMINFHENDSEALIGRKSFSQGMNSKSYGNVAAGINSMNTAQATRDLGLIRRFADAIIASVKMIISLNQEYLDDGQVFRISNQPLKIKRDALVGEFDVKIKISTPQQKQDKKQNLSFLLQTLGTTVPFDITKDLMADVAALDSMPQSEKKLRDYQPQPDPVAQEHDKLKNSYLQTQIDMLKSSIYENSADYQLKLSKVESELAKADSLRSDSDLKDINLLREKKQLDVLNRIAMENNPLLQ